MIDINNLDKLSVACCTNSKEDKTVCCFKLELQSIDYLLNICFRQHPLGLKELRRGCSTTFICAQSSNIDCVSFLVAESMEKSSSFSNYPYFFSSYHPHDPILQAFTILIMLAFLEQMVAASQFQIAKLAT